MGKFLLAFMIVSASGNAFAEWVVIGFNDAFAFYADPTTIRRDGNSVKVCDAGYQGDTARSRREAVYVTKDSTGSHRHPNATLWLQQEIEFTYFC